MTDYLSKKIRIISFLAILLVFLQHSINFTGYIDPGSLFLGKATINTLVQYVVGYGLARPAVALFFLLSGYLFFRNYTLGKTFEKYRSRFKTLFIPYIVWNALALLFIIAMQLFFSGFSQSFYTGYLPGRTMYEYLQIVFHHGVAFQLWFLYDLMLYTLFAPIIYMLVRYVGIILLLPLCLFWLIRIPLPLFFSFLDRGGLFYLMGAYLAIHPISISEIVSKRIFTIVGILWLLSLAVKTYIAFRPSGFITYLPVIDNITISFGLLTVWFGYDAFADSRIWSWLGTQALFTFFIYAAHEPLLELLKYVGVTIMGKDDATLLICYFFVPIVTYGLCIISATFLKRYTSFVYKVLSGGR